MVEVRGIVAKMWTRIVEFDVEKSFTTVRQSTQPADSIVLGKRWSLFTFDFKRKAAVFLHSNVEQDFSKAPFVYNVQFENADQVALVTFDELLEITERLQDIPNLVQFFSTGHCGSTLLHHVFNRVPDVWCVSEPIAFNALALNSCGCDEALKLNLARGALRLVARFSGAETAQHIIVKHFSQSTPQLTLLNAAHPKGRNIFLYRDALGWANSFYHFVQKYGTGMALSKQERVLMWQLMSGGMPEAYLEGILDLSADLLGFDQLAAVAWATQMQHFDEARRKGVALHPLRYNELVKNRQDSIAALFDVLGLPRDAVAATLSVFDKDAHEGTRSARSENDLHFGPENYAVVEAMLAHPRIAVDPQIILK